MGVLNVKGDVSISQQVTVAKTVGDCAEVVAAGETCYISLMGP